MSKAAKRSRKSKKAKKKRGQAIVAIKPGRLAEIKAAVAVVTDLRQESGRRKQREIAQLRAIIDLVHTNICPLCKGKKIIAIEGRRKTCPACKGSGVPQLRPIKEYRPGNKEQ